MQHRLVLGIACICVSLQVSGQVNTTRFDCGSTTNSTQYDTDANQESPYINDVNVTKLEDRIDDIMAKAIINGETPGGVVSVVRLSREKKMEEHQPASIFSKAYGLRAKEPVEEPATIDTIYDLASLTKPLATAMSIMLLVEQGKIQLDDKVSDYIPEWKNTNTIRHLLTHTSGLPSYVSFNKKYSNNVTPSQVIGEIAKVNLKGSVGGQFIYSDLGYIVLGDIVERVSKERLDVFCQKNIFEPLDLKDTGFLVMQNTRDRVAPTEWEITTNTASGITTETMLRGIVHDGNARVLGGVCGHAGMFSTVTNLSRYMAVLLNGGYFDNGTIISPLTIELMAKDHANLPATEAQRGLGWDIDSQYSSPRGDIFKTGFGHTGSTGTSIWVVPEEKLAIIILTNRVHPRGKGDANSLRVKIANAVAGCILKSYRTSE